MFVEIFKVKNHTRIYILQCLAWYMWCSAQVDRFIHMKLRLNLLNVNADQQTNNPAHVPCCMQHSLADGSLLHLVRKHLHYPLLTFPLSLYTGHEQCPDILIYWFVSSSCFIVSCFLPTPVVETSLKHLITKDKSWKQVGRLVLPGHRPLDFHRVHAFFCESIVSGIYFVHICCVCIVKVISKNVFLRLKY